eukprot:Rhum_TRINITY_DN12766_c2_g1::Rhum_TRINITY_DN12766_c2_g1_i1::g.54266::m.54266/K03259/EIF4E; translation initiation factor 4E
MADMKFKKKPLKGSASSPGGMVFTKEMAAASDKAAAAVAVADTDEKKNLARRRTQHVVSPISSTSDAAGDEHPNSTPASPDAAAMMARAEAAATDAATATTAEAAAPAVPAAAVPAISVQVDSLKDDWAIWFDKSMPKSPQAGASMLTAEAAAGDKQTAYDDSIVELGSFSSHEAFLQYWTSLRAQHLKNNCNLRVFRRGVQPLSTHEANVNGGKYVVREVPKAQRGRLWARAVSLLVSEKLECGTTLNGGVFSTRAEGDSVQLWVGEGAKDAAARDAASKKLRCLIFGEPTESGADGGEDPLAFTYQSHDALHGAATSPASLKDSAAAQPVPAAPAPLPAAAVSVDCSVTVSPPEDEPADDAIAVKTVYTSEGGWADAGGGGSSAFPLSPTMGSKLVRDEMHYSIQPAYYDQLASPCGPRPGFAGFPPPSPNAAGLASPPYTQHSPYAEPHQQQQQQPVAQFVQQQSCPPAVISPVMSPMHQQHQQQQQQQNQYAIAVAAQQQ